LKEFPTLRLAIIPRHPERFDAVAQLIQQSGFPVIRRSAGTVTPSTQTGIMLGDTMGELRKFYALATIVLVGRTLLDLGHRQRGSDMIEPAALAKPTVVGPWTQNFAEVMTAFRTADAIREVRTPGGVTATIAALLRDSPAASDLGRRAQRVVVNQRGATARNVRLILDRLPKGIS